MTRRVITPAGLKHTRHPLAVKLTSRRRLIVNAVGSGLWVSGVLWLLFHYFVQVKGEFGPGPSPLEPWWLKLHAVFAFAATWAFGLLWGVHVVNGWTLRRRRWSGALSVGVLLVLIASGYLLYYVGDDAARKWTALAHWIIGLGLPAVYLGHRMIETAVVRRRLRRNGGGAGAPHAVGEADALPTAKPARVREVA